MTSIQDCYKPRARGGCVIWITGLSGAGKTTLAKEIGESLRASGQLPVVLDGDELRDVMGLTTQTSKDFDREARLALAMQYGRLCRILAQQDLTVVIATISMYREIHTWNRANLPNYFEVYLKVPLDELRRRDPKGLYKQFDDGQIRLVAGLDLTIDEPECADLTIDFTRANCQDVSATASLFFDAWKEWCHK